MKDWMSVLPEEERETYLKAGFAGKLPMGERAALVVIDVTLGFTGSKGLSLDDAIKEYKTACGPASWEAMPKISRLIELFRQKQLPVIYTIASYNDQTATGRATKSNEPVDPNTDFNKFPEEIAPKEGEWVIEKAKASAFFGTPITTYLTQHKIDTLVLCGTTTSGCIRASTIDSCSHGYTTFVIDEACFDRSHFAHCANLFDMNAKYASVISVDELEEMM